MKNKGDMIKNSLGVKKTKNSYSKLDQKNLSILLTYIFDSDEKNL